MEVCTLAKLKIRGVAQPGSDFAEIENFDAKSRILEK